MGDETIANRENQNLTHHLHVEVLESCILVNGYSSDVSLCLFLLHHL